jgi:chromatin remodeling complex protein RSC6
MSMSNAVQTEQDHAGTKAARKPNPALMKPLQPSTELAGVVGSSPLPRTEVVSKV